MGSAPAGGLLAVPCAPVRVPRCGKGLPECEAEGFGFKRYGGVYMVEKYCVTKLLKKGTNEFVSCHRWKREVK